MFAQYLFLIKKDAVLAKKRRIFSTEVNREFTLLLPGVAHLVAVKTAEQILNKCLHTGFRAESIDWVLNHS